jgi:arylsulfatase A-like enzyme
MSTPERPNVLILLSDQLRRDALSVYGNPDLDTPNVDRLAGQGACFTNACSTYPICVPFRFTLMTGQTAQSRLVPGIEWRMSPAERTLADEFNDAGYETLYVGKWHLYGDTFHMPGYGRHHEGRRPVPRRFQGRWQHWRGFELRNDPFHTYYFVDDDPTPRPVPGYQTDGLFDIAMDFLARDRDESKPFCAVVSFEPPHPPYEAPKELEDAWMSRDITLPENFFTEPPSFSRPDRILDESHRQVCLDSLKKYYAMVQNLDQNVGRMMDFLQRQGLAENTVVLLFSDHGDSLGSHCIAHKQFPFEESVGIPLVVAGPGVEPGRRLPQPTCTEDLFPTILGLAGLQPRDHVPGENLAALLAGRVDSVDRPGVLLGFVSELRDKAAFYQRTWRAFRSERYCYIVCGDNTGAKPVGFYDLQADPRQMNDLLDSSEHRELVAQHHRWLRDELLRIEDDYPLAAAFGCEELHVYPDERLPV